MKTENYEPRRVSVSKQDRVSFFDPSFVPAVGSDGFSGDSTPRFACCGVKHRWAYNWLKARNWRPEAWALYALRGDYKGKHDGEHSIPVRVRALAEDVWSDLQAGRITSETTILDYEAIPAEGEENKIPS